MLRFKPARRKSKKSVPQAACVRQIPLASSVDALPGTGEQRGVTKATQYSNISLLAVTKVIYIYYIYCQFTTQPCRTGHLFHLRSTLVVYLSEFSVELLSPILNVFCDYLSIYPSGKQNLFLLA